MKTTKVNPVTGRRSNTNFADKGDTNPNGRSIVSVDSEGVNLPLSDGVTSANPYVSMIDPKTGEPRGWHTDVMLVAADDKGTVREHLLSDGSRREASGDYARNYGLRTTDVLEFLLNLPVPANGIVTSFVFSYDETKLLADLPLACMQDLTNDGAINKDDWLDRISEASDIMHLPYSDIANYQATQITNLIDSATTIYDGRYWLHYIPRKQLEIIDLSAGKAMVQDVRDGKPIGKARKQWLRKQTIWDSFGFFQKSFVGALKDYRCGICDACKAALAHCKTKCPECAKSNHCLNAPWSLTDLARIESMKAHRGAFTSEETEEILAYCYSECEYLSFLYRDLLSSIHKFNPDLYSNTNRHDGSGAIASAYIKTFKIGQRYPERIPSTVEVYKQKLNGHHCDKCADTFKYNHCAYCGTDYDGIAELSDNLDTHDPILEPAMHVGGNHAKDAKVLGLPEAIALAAYGGGRFEVSEIGYMGPSLHGYDINSAYPHIIRFLPCLAHGYFERVTEYVPGSFGVYECGSRTSGTWAPFQFRRDETYLNDTAKQAMYYAHGGKRWVWSVAGSEQGESLSEVAVARKHFGENAIPIYDGYVWVSECAEYGCDGLAFGQKILDLYELRKQFVREGNGVEKVLKLILNSLYGKTAQSIGGSKDGKTGLWKPARSQCFAWAGMITSGCRAMILDAIMDSEADVVCIATDGIQSRTPITSLYAPKEKILGAWDYGEYEDGYLFQSGVYTYLTWDKWRNDYKRIYKTRGFSPKEIEAEHLIAAYMCDETTVVANPDQSRFIQMRAGVNRIDGLEYIGQWIPSEHDIRIEHTRRLARAFDEEGDPVEGIVRYSDPAVMCCIDHKCEPCKAGNHNLCVNPPMSAPYKPKQSWEEVLDAQEDYNGGDFMEAEPEDIPTGYVDRELEGIEWMTANL